MSMGGGVCVPQMMYPQGSQHMYSATIPHYSPMGIPQMMFAQGSQHMSYPMFPVHANFQGTPGSNHPIHGHLCPGFQSTIPRPPLRISASDEAPSTSLNLNSEDPMKSTNMHNAGGSRPVSRANKQVGARLFYPILRRAFPLQVSALSLSLISNSLMWYIQVEESTSILNMWLD